MVWWLEMGRPDMVDVLLFVGVVRWVGHGVWSES